LIGVYFANPAESLRHRLDVPTLLTSSVEQLLYFRGIERLTRNHMGIPLDSYRELMRYEIIGIL
jgi:hypothetical protein